jgi:hypothetical protein
MRTPLAVRRVAAPVAVALAALATGASLSHADTTPAATAPSTGSQAPAASAAVPGAASAATPTASPAPATSGAAPAATNAPQQPWLTDDAGRKYRLGAYPKKYRHEVTGNKLRTAWGITVDIDHEDSESYYYRVYEVDPNASGPKEVLPPIPPGVKASYELVVPKVDRLTLVPFDDGLPTEGQWRNGFAIADINGDGFLDIVHAPPRKGTGGLPVIFLGDGKGHWHRWDATFPEFPYDYGDAAVADLDHDGRLDIVIASHLHGVVALVQKQPGKFELWNKGLPFRMTPQDPIGFSSRANAVLDWNGDKRPDIAALSEGPQLQVDRSGGKITKDSGLFVYLNQGDGSWKEVPLTVPKSGLFGDHLEAVDMDHDGHADLLVSSNAEGRKDLLYLGGGKAPAGRREILSAMRAGYARSVVPIDIEGKGKMSIAAAFLSFETREWKTGIDVLQRKGKEWQRKLVWVEDGNAGVWSMATGDVDGDGHADIVALTGDGRVILLLGDGKGGFAQQDVDVTKKAGGCIGAAVRIADLDGDHRGEIIAEFAGEEVGTPGIGSSPGCPGQGSIHVWKTQPKAASTPPAAPPKQGG